MLTEPILTPPLGDGLDHCTHPSDSGGVRAVASAAERTVRPISGRHRDRVQGAGQDLQVGA
jgi:hypothetical protein